MTNQAHYTYQSDPTTRTRQEAGTNQLRHERNRAYLLIVILLGVIVAQALAILFIMPLKTVVPAIATIDENSHVTKVQVVNVETMLSNESLISSELHQFITNCNTVDETFRQRLSDLCRLHATPEVARQYDGEYSPENPQNPYYLLGAKGKRSVVITAVNLLDKDKGLGQVTYRTVTEKAGSAPTTEYWTATLRYTFTGLPLSIGDRWENPLGFAVTAYRKDQELSRN